MSKTSIPSNMIRFIKEHHVLSLATIHKNSPSLCSVFYTFMSEENCFIFASESKSEHIQNIMKNNTVAACIHDEVRDVRRIKGIQVKGKVLKADAHHDEAYIKTFPEAQEIKKEVWILELTELKYTDNENIGFGQKETWNR